MEAIETVGSEKILMDRYQPNGPTTQEDVHI